MPTRFAAARNSSVPLSTPLILTLLILTASAAALKLHPRHDGKSHNAAHEAVRRVHPREAPEANGLGVTSRVTQTAVLLSFPSTPVPPAGNGPAGGIGIIGDPLPPPLFPPPPSAPTTSISVALNSPVRPLTPGFVPTPPSNAINPSSTSYAFPLTTLHVPLATVCPDTPPTSAIFSILPIPTTTGNGSATDYTSISTGTCAVVKVTAPLANGSSSVFLSTISTPVPSILTSPPNNTNTAAQDRLADAAAGTAARILLDGNGCQTVYAPVTTAVCSTTVRLVGVPDATVSACEQYVTFSSDAPGCVWPEGTATITQQASKGEDTVAMRPFDDSLTAGMPRLTPSVSEGLPGTYYAAHWYDLAQGGVARDVDAVTCSPAAGPAPGPWVQCATGKQRWTVSTVTKTVATSSVARCSGPAILTAGAMTITTTLSFETTVTKTVTVTSLTVVRQKLSTVASEVQEQGTVTVLATVATTVQLGEVPRTRMSTSEVWVTVMSEVTRQVFETRTRV